jgi:hypothetical protein
MDDFFFAFLPFSLFYMFFFFFFFFFGSTSYYCLGIALLRFCYFLKESVRVVVSGLYLRCFLFACFLDVYELACCAFCTPPVCVCASALSAPNRTGMGWFPGEEGEEMAAVYIDSPTLSLVPYSFFFFFSLVYEL